MYEYNESALYTEHLWLSTSDLKK